ncbi:hypothetical protein Rcae01_00685 [Novipirellula caenicola]|uniref:Uncharacterized protein n=1 Tax=Novipirellula caenicola TaxID=1536901 RepID=A0ABP9VJ60_9BACT
MEGAERWDTAECSRHHNFFALDLFAYLRYGARRMSRNEDLRGPQFHLPGVSLGNWNMAKT